MSYVGKVKVSSAWTKLEDLIQAQVDGQSAFAFDTSKTYSVQADTQEHVVIQLTQKSLYLNKIKQQ